MVEWLKDLAVADRESDWEAHLFVAHNILPISREFDSINYLRYRSLHLENMRRLPEEHPEICNKFMQGHFIVKQINRSFNAVAEDMKAEQTI